MGRIKVERKVRTGNVNEKLTAKDLGWKQDYKQKIKTAQVGKVTYSDWPSEDRINAIGQNGGDGAHYEELV